MGTGPAARAPNMFSVYSTLRGLHSKAQFNAGTGRRKERGRATLVRTPDARIWRSHHCTHARCTHMEIS